MHHGLVQFFVVFEVEQRGVTALAQGLDLFDGVAEDEDVVFANGIQDFHVGAVQRTHGQRAVQRKFHVAGAGGFGARQRDLFGDIGGGDDDLRQADAIVGDEDDFDQVVDAAIVVDDVRHVVDEVDDFLRRVVGACCFTGEDEDARHPFTMRVFQDLVVAADDVQHVQELPLVFVDALDLYVKEGFGVHFDAEFVFDVLSEAAFVFEFDATDFGAEGGIFFERVEFCQLLKVAAPVFTDVTVKHLRKAGVGKRDPAARGNAVRNVGEAFRPEAGKVSKEGFDHEVGVDFGDAVHFVRADNGQPGHAHAATAFFVDDGDTADEVVIHALFAQFAQEVFVDFEDELQVARQDAADHFYRPAFQRFAHQGVVGVGEDFLTGSPGVVPLDGVFVDQDTHQLRDGEHGVGVVQMDGDGLGEVGQVVVFFEVTAHDILHRGGDEEVFLAQAQFAADSGGVVRVENTRDVFRGVLFFDSGKVVAFVEVAEVENVARVCPP